MMVPSRRGLVVRWLLMAVALSGGVLWLAPREQVASTVAVRFEERAQASGCLHEHTMVRLADVFENIMPWLSSVGAAAAAGDFDGDGFSDLYVTSSGRGDRNVLFHNLGDGTFEDVTDQAGVGCGNPTGASMHAVWGDVDNDERIDLYVVKWAEPNQLFHNNGDGTFSDVSRVSGTDFWGYGNGATFLDYDRDGHLDLLVGNYFADVVPDPDTGKPVRNDLWHPVTTRVMHDTFTHAANGGRNVLFRNLGDGTFEDVTVSVGMTFTGWTLAVGSGDVNTGATEQPPKFRLVVDPRGHPGVGNDWWKGMNVDMGDVNNDGYLDIYVTNVLEPRYKTDEGNMLWINCTDPLCPGGRGFINVGRATGTFNGGWGWGGKFADFNNDGWLDIYAVNGFVTGDPDHNYWYQIQEMVTQTKNQTADAADWPVMGDRDLSGHEHGRLFMHLPDPEGTTKNRNLRFVEMSQAAGVVDRYNGRGIALADFNHDGLLDMYIANQGARSCYYVNITAGDAPATAPSHGFLRLELRGRPDAGVAVGDRMLASTTDAVGARVTIHTGDGVQIREVQGGMGFASQSEHAVHFGLADPSTLDRVTIRWPSGRVQAFEGEAARALVNTTTPVVEPIEEVAAR